MSAGQPALTIAPPAGDYWRDSARPLVSLAFVAPFLLFYEGGAAFVGSNAARNGADLWLRRLLDLAGFSQYFLLPLLTCGLLLAWHHARREPWRIGARVVAGMWLEAAAWGVGLLLVAQTALLLHGEELLRTAAAAMTGEQAANDFAGRFVGYLGAGIYEELLFRLMLLPATIALLRAARLSRQASLATAVVLTSLAFAAAHYRLDLTPLGLPARWTCGGEPFTPLGFVFRFAGGASLATLFACRGFGIAVGAHAMYDLLVLLY